MIKLIASDMDGTLLNSEKQLPADFSEVINRLFERNITFAVASGRTYSALEYLFPEDVRSKLSFICDNGACTVAGGKTINVTPIERSVYLELLDACEKIGGLTAVVCAESGVFHEKCAEEFFDEVGVYYKNHRIAESLRDIEGEIYKLAICDDGEALVHGKTALDAIFGGRLNVLVSGVMWMDVMAGGVSKGTALKALQQTLGVTRDETMAFGDYFNDVDMLMLAKWSFCMENGHDDVKKLCEFTAPDNDHSGVTRCIKRYVLDSEDQ